LSVARAARAGIEHGRFIGIAHDLFVADANGVSHLRTDSRDGIKDAFG
jgi:hypothetical protein